MIRYSWVKWGVIFDFHTGESVAIHDQKSPTRRLWLREKGVFLSLWPAWRRDRGNTQGFINYIKHHEGLKMDKPTGGPNIPRNALLPWIPSGHACRWHPFTPAYIRHSTGHRRAHLRMLMLPGHLRWFLFGDCQQNVTDGIPDAWKEYSMPFSVNCCTVVFIIS